MLLIGALCLAVGFCTYEPQRTEVEKIEPVIPPSPYAIDAAAPAGDADATAR